MHLKFEYLRLASLQFGHSVKLPECNNSSWQCTANFVLHSSAHGGDNGVPLSEKRVSPTSPVLGTMKLLAVLGMYFLSSPNACLPGQWDQQGLHLAKQLMPLVCMYARGCAG